MDQTTIYLSLGLHKGRPSYRRSLQPSKKNIQDFKTWKFCTFFYFCGQFFPSWSRIRNLNADPDPDPATQINADPCGSGSGYGSGSETLVKNVYFWIFTLQALSKNWLLGQPITFPRFSTIRLADLFTYHSHIKPSFITKEIILANAESVFIFFFSTEIWKAKYLLNIS